MPGPTPADADLDILQYVQEVPLPFVTAKDVDKRTSVGYRQTRNRLDDLYDEGYLRRRKVGEVKTYWLSDAGEEALLRGEL